MFGRPTELLLANIDCDGLVVPDPTIRDTPAEPSEQPGNDWIVEEGREQASKEESSESESFGVGGRLQSYGPCPSTIVSSCTFGLRSIFRLDVESSERSPSSRSKLEDTKAAKLDEGDRGTRCRDIERCNVRAIAVDVNLSEVTFQMKKIHHRQQGLER